MNNTDMTKPQADNKGLLDILGHTQQATDAIIANDDFLNTLKQIGQVESLLTYPYGFSIDGEKVETKGKVIIPFSVHDKK